MKRAAFIIVALVAVLGAPADALAAGQISGTVSPITAADETEVCLVELPVSENCTYPRFNGTYTLTGAALGSNKVEFIPSYRSRYVLQYYQHAHSVGEATTITLTASSPTRTEVNAELELGGEIEGTVTNSLGVTPIAGVEVCAIEAGKKVPAGCTFTDGAGDYGLGALPAGTYKVGFWGHGASAEYAPRYFEGQATLASATPITLAAGASQAGVDGHLAKGAKVIGSVRAAATDAVLPGTSVCLFAGAAATPTQCTFTDGSGGYSFLGISPGGYQVGFSLGSAEIGGEAASSEDDGYLTQYYHGVANRSEALTLTLAGEQVDPGIDGQLLTPPVAPPAPPPPVVPANVVAAPTLISEPVKPKTLKCKKGFVKKKVKGVERCVKKKPAKKHRKQTKKHGTGAKNPNGRD